MPILPIVPFPLPILLSVIIQYFIPIKRHRRNTVSKTVANQSITSQATVTIDNIDILPDDVLLEIFTFYLVERPDIIWYEGETWLTLVHVCRRWRSIIFALPHALDLRIRCTQKRRVREMLGFWPALSLVVHDEWGSLAAGADNIIAAVEHNDRVRQVLLTYLSSSALESIAAVMQEPFPALTHLHISAPDGTPVFPEAFLGGSAQRLRWLDLRNIVFPGIRRLLFSAANHLVYLRLEAIPHSTYIPPDAMVTCLSTIANLEDLIIGFRSPRSRPDRAIRPPPPPTRVVLPTLNSFTFVGVSEYIEDLISRIDIPLLVFLDITYFNQLIFDTPRLHDFLSRTEQFKVHNRAAVKFDGDAVHFSLSRLWLRISCSKSDWQLSGMAQICESALPLFIPLERLDICQSTYSYSLPRQWQYDAESAQWLELLHSFTTLKDLYVDKKFAPLLAPALQELSGESVTEELPALQNLYIQDLKPSGPVQEAIGQFVAARQLSGLPVSVHRWDGVS
jgi:hypothetical protein